MNSSFSEMKEVEHFFKGKGITIFSNNVWLRSCVECFRSQCNNYTKKELIDFVFEQWLLADLREVCSSTLPKECSTLEKYILLGRHAVQLNFSIDISTSSYLQYQKVKKPDAILNLNVDSEREAEEPSHFFKKTAKRALKLEITDGQLTVTGFEDKPIKCLKNPVPGEKALLKGPIECRKGVLMLTERNVEILGGEVDTLLIPNAGINVLAKRLGEPEDPDPYKQLENQPGEEGKEILSNYLEEDDEALLMLAESMEAETLPPPSSSMSNTLASSSSSMSNTLPPPSRLTNSDTLIGSSNSTSVVNNNLNFEDDDDDFDLVAAQTASLAEFEASQRSIENIPIKTNIVPETLELQKIRQSPITSIKKPFTISDSIEYVDINDPKRLKKELEETYRSGCSYQKIHSVQLKSGFQDANVSQTTTYRTGSQMPGHSSEHLLLKVQGRDKVPENKPSASIPFSDDSKTKSNVELGNNRETDSPKELRLLEKSRVECDNSSFESPSWMTSEPEDLEMDLSEPDCISDDNVESFHQPYPPRKFPALRVVRGKVIQVCEKLSLKNDQWCLAAIVSANGLDIEMTFASELLDRIFGITAAELMARRKEIKTNPAAKEQMNKTLRDSQLRIKNLDCEMVIRFSSVIAKPVIIDVMQK